MINILDILFPGKARLKQELAKVSEEMVPLTENLVGWEGDELELMSLIQEERKIKGSFDKTVSGIICSIYHEHMAAYLWRKIFGLGDYTILVIVTKKYRFEYVTKGGKTSFYVDDQFLGEFRRDNKLYLNKKRILGSVDISSSPWWDIKVENTFVGSLVNLKKARHINPRAFQMQRGISKDAEMVFLSIALYKIVELTRKERKIPFR